jgi:transposase-like protein
MKFSKYQIKQRNALKTKAIKLYKQGLTLRQVAPIIGKSSQWVWRAVKETVDNS